MEVVHPEAWPEMEHLPVDRRPSLNSLDAKDTIQYVSPDVASKLMPPWLVLALRVSGGSLEGEHGMSDVLLMFGALGHMTMGSIDIWFLGIPAVPDCIVLWAVMITTVIVIAGVRRRFLQSGILLSLAQDLDATGKILGSYNAKTKMILFSVFVDQLILGGVFVVFGFYLDVSDRAASVGPTWRTLALVATLVSTVILQPMAHLTVKMVPVLFVATYDLLVEDMRRFLYNMDALFKDDNMSSQTVDKLQVYEHVLRTRLALVNDIVSPGVGQVLGCYMTVMTTVTIFAILTIKNGGDGSVIFTYIFIAVFCFTLVVLLLQGTARVGDMWVRVIEDLDTPVICVRSTAILKLPLADRLRRLHFKGVEVFGCAITSRTVFTIAARLGAGLFLALLGTVVTSR